MNRKSMAVLLVLLLVFSLACAALKSRPTPTIEITQEPTKDVTTEAPTEEVPSPSGAVASLDEVKSATIQIEAQGTFVDPEGTQTSSAGRGSGFIIDPSGIAVTNNHVVAGAGLLKVWVGGESEPRNAKILGGSECSDLAVIDLEGDGYPYLEPYEGDVTTGLDIYAAGFPLGDPEFTLTRGIISKEHADGDTDWASVDSVLEHDAVINPGNSGGPLVTEDGQIVGVNYAAYREAQQSFAIAWTEAESLVEKLRDGDVVDSLGVNAQAVILDDDLAGVWAASVQSGSPADKAGVQAGDIIVQLENLSLAGDGTLADYCDILRTHSPDDTLSVEVVRFATQEVWAGQINGRELALSFSFEQQGREDVEMDSGATYADYVTIEDDSDAIVMDVPAEWSDVDGSPWMNEDEVLGPSLTASTDVEGFNSSYDVPGVFFAAASMGVDFDVDELLDATGEQEGCVYEGRYDYQDELYTGRYDYYTDCGDSGSVLFIVVAAPESQDFLTLVLVQAVTDADLEAADHVFNTFTVVGDLSGDSGGSSGSSGGDASLEITNYSEELVSHLYIAPVDDDSWGDDWLGGSVIEDGEIYLVEGIPEDYYDIRVSDDDDYAIETLYDVEVSGEMTWDLWPSVTLPDNAEVRFEDDFSDNHNSWGDSESEGVVYHAPEDGEYCISINTSNMTAWEWYEPFRTDEFFGEVYCVVDPDTDASCGIGFGPDGDNLFWYELDPSTQSYALFILEDDEWLDPLLEWASSSWINPYGGNYIALSQVDGEVSVYVNGRLLDSVYSDAFPSGRFAIGGATYDDDYVDVCLDDMTVWQLQ